MTIREEIIKLLDVPVGELTEYDKLKNCIKTELYERIGKDWRDLVNFCPDTVDQWFQGVIQSLFYKPNHYLLVLEGKSPEHLEDFFLTLVPHQLRFDDRRKVKTIYNSLIYEVEFEYQKQQDILEKENFIILEENAKALIHPATDKRLCSYCTTTEKWRYPQRKNVIVLSVESIDWELYNSIDKLKLWQELFFKYKTTNNDTNL